MNKYRDKSDFEINCQVLATFEPDIEHMCLSHDKKSFYHCGFDGNGFYETTIPDYCNNPADAFPLIIDVKLSIHPDFYNDCESWVVRTAHIPLVKDKSLTRAICIAYLMMKDAENEK